MEQNNNTNNTNSAPETHEQAKNAPGPGAGSGAAGNAGNGRFYNYRRYRRHWFAGLFIFFVIIFVLIVVLFFARQRDFRRGVVVGFGTKGAIGRMGNFGGGRFNVRAGGPGGPGNAGLAGGTRVFGKITGVSGSNITITDNSGQSETVVSSANTSITSSSGTQIGLSDLKSGESIIATGTSSQNQIQARAIFVQQ